MKNFFVIANKSKKEAIDLQDRLSEYIIDKGGVCAIDESPDGHTDVNGIPSNTEGILVLGGDGTMLRVSHELGGLDLPLLGINTGNIGYLTAVDKNEAFGAIDRMFSDDYVTEPRMMVSSIIIKQDGAAVNNLENKALNEIVIKGNKPMQLLVVSVYINDQFLKTYEADGIIISTPTGSTGYNLSAGGPVLNPSADMMILTPICPHSMNSRSLVFSSKDTIRIIIEKGRSEGIQGAEVYYDATDMEALVTGDEIIVKKAEQVSKIVKLTQESFLETLQKKLRDN